MRDIPLSFHATAVGSICASMFGVWLVMEPAGGNGRPAPEFGAAESVPQAVVEALARAVEIQMAIEDVRAADKAMADAVERAAGAHRRYLEVMREANLQ